MASDINFDRNSQKKVNINNFDECFIECLKNGYLSIISKLLENDIISIKYYIEKLLSIHNNLQYAYQFINLIIDEDLDAEMSTKLLNMLLVSSYYDPNTMKDMVIKLFEKDAKPYNQNICFLCKDMFFEYINNEQIYINKELVIHSLRKNVDNKISNWICIENDNIDDIDEINDILHSAHNKIDIYIFYLKKLFANGDINNKNTFIFISHTLKNINKPINIKEILPDGFFIDRHISFVYLFMKQIFQSYHNVTIYDGFLDSEIQKYNNPNIIGTFKYDDKLMQIVYSSFFAYTELSNADKKYIDELIEKLEIE